MKTKEIVLSVLLVISALASFWAWPRILERPYLALVVLFYAVIFGFFLLLVKNFWLFWAMPPVSLLFGAAFFNRDWFLFYGLILGIAIITYAGWLKSEEEKASIKISLKRVVGQSLQLFFTVLALFFAFIYYGSVYKNPDPTKLLLPESVFEITLKLMAAPLSEAMPGFNASDKKLSHALYDLSLARVKDYAGDYIGYVPLLAAASYFFALKAVSVLFYYAALALIFILLKLLLAAGLVKKEIIAAQKEIYV